MVLRLYPGPPSTLHGSFACRSLRSFGKAHDIGRLKNQLPMLLFFSCFAGPIFAHAVGTFIVPGETGHGLTSARFSSLQSALSGSRDGTFRVEMNYGIRLSTSFFGLAYVTHVNACKERLPVCRAQRIKAANKARHDSSVD